MKKYFISNFSVRELWGYKNYPIEFNEDVNVIIGPNASGKTTLINILYDSLSGNFPRLCRTEFAEVSIKLKAFEGKDVRTLRITRTDKELRIHIGNKPHVLPIAPLLQIADDFDYHDMLPLYARQLGLGFDIQELQQKMQQLVPAVWLPVSRRLPIADEKEMEQRRLRRKPLESVDECLAGLTTSLQQYRFALNTEISKLRRDFQRHALENILYDKEHDDTLELESFDPPSEQDKQALLKAFQDVGLDNSDMEKRIHGHFEAATKARAKLNRGEGIDIETFFIVTLVNRTQKIVKFAQDLRINVNISYRLFTHLKIS